MRWGTGCCYLLDSASGTSGTALDCAASTGCSSHYGASSAGGTALDGAAGTSGSTHDLAAGAGRATGR
jgi:hypothetical protein